MSGSTNSALGNENLKAECNSKREAESEGADVTAKKLKTETASESTGRNDEVENGRLGGDVREAKNGSAVVKMSRELNFVIEADVAEDKGTRHAMEDASVVLLDASMDFPGRLRCAHFAVYDGHGGRLAAEHAQKHLHLNVLSAGLPRELVDVKAAKRAILEGFRKTDESLLQESTAGGWHDGATAVCVWILGQKVFVANIGDAKAVVARSPAVTNLHNHPESESPLKAIVLTREHKAIYQQERARIEKAGGIVSSNGRIQGRLEVSRAFGDRQFKKVGVIATPDIHSFELTERDHFMIIGCDGLWGVFGPNDAVDFVWKLLKKDNLSIAATSRHLVREAVRERRCKDNCTAIVIVFRHKSE